MSKAAEKLSQTASNIRPVKRGPSSGCMGVYEPDLEDAEAIQAFRIKPTESWATAQIMYDKLAGTKVQIPNDRFRYHWNRFCWCWPADQRRSR